MSGEPGAPRARRGERRPGGVQGHGGLLRRRREGRVTWARAPGWGWPRDPDRGGSSRVGAHGGRRERRTTPRPRCGSWCSPASRLRLRTRAEVAASGGRRRDPSAARTLRRRSRSGSERVLIRSGLRERTAPRRDVTAGFPGARWRMFWNGRPGARSAHVGERSIRLPERRSGSRTGWTRGERGSWWSSADPGLIRRPSGPGARASQDAFGKPDGTPGGPARDRSRERPFQIVSRTGNGLPGRRRPSSARDPVGTRGPLPRPEARPGRSEHAVPCLVPLAFLGALR